MQQQPDADKPPADAESGESTDNPAGHHSQAERVIAKFGGIRPMASKLGIAVTTVQGWKERGTIPPRRQPEILAAAQAAGIALAESDFAPAEGTAEPAPTEEPMAEPVEPKAAGPWRAAGTETPKETPVIDAPPQPKAGSGGGRTALWIVIVLVIGGLAAGAGWWYGRQDVAGVDLGPIERRLAAAEAKLERLPEIEAAAKSADQRAAAAADAVARLETTLKQQGDRVATVEGKMSAVEDKVASGAAAAPADDSALRAAVDEAKQAAAAARAETERTVSALRDDVASRVAGVRDANAQALADIRAETQRLAGALDAATKRIAALEAAKAEATAGGARVAALVAAIGQLRVAVLSGRPYETELQSVEVLEDDPAPAPAALAARAASGVSSIETLRGAFERRAAAIVDAASAPEGGDWLDRTWHRVSTIVTVRRTGGELAGDDAEAVVGRAERQLRDGDLAGAVATLGALKGPAAAAARDWLADARATLDALAAVKALQDAALARVAQAGAAASGPATPGPATSGTATSGTAPGGGGAAQ